jgi:hypothetical protein
MAFAMTTTAEMSLALKRAREISASSFFTIKPHF